MPTEKVTTPKFLSRKMILKAIEFAVNSVLESPALIGFLEPKRHQLHVVVLTPGIIDNDRADEGHNTSATDYLFAPVGCEMSFGDKATFEHPYDVIAMSKAIQLWSGLNDGRTDCIPHLLFSGETPYWGGVKREGLVVSCSGLQPHLDKLISGIVADTIIAMAYDAWMRSSDREAKNDFLT